MRKSFLLTSLALLILVCTGCVFEKSLPTSIQSLVLPSTSSTPSPVSVVVSLPALPTWANGAVASVGSATQVTVKRLSQAVTTTPSGAPINIGANFLASSPVSQSTSLVASLVNSAGTTVAQATNSLSNGLTYLPSSIWNGPISVTTSLSLPNLSDGTYYLMLSLNTSAGPLTLTADSGIARDNQYRYYVGAVVIQASAPAASLLPPVTLNLSGYHLTFDDEFSNLSISDASTNDGSRWYTLNEQCCMQTSDGAGTAMVGLSSPYNPYSLVSGGGLNIRLQKNSNAWTSGVLTSVDNHGTGFSQQYGYFEMKAKFPSGLNTWPAFWLLSTAAKSSGAPAGEIDIVEYIANPGFDTYFSTTLHDWSNSSAQPYSHNSVTKPSDGFHTYGMLWTASTMTFYFDGTVTFQTPTPSIMNQPYYFLVNLGIGAGWPTDATPVVNDMIVQYIRAYSL